MSCTTAIPVAAMTGSTRVCPGWGGRFSEFTMEFELDFTNQQITVYMTSAASSGVRTASSPIPWNIGTAADLYTNGGMSWYGWGGGNMTIDNVYATNVTPEPVTLVLMGVGSMVLLRRRRRG